MCWSFQVQKWFEASTDTNLVKEFSAHNLVWVLKILIKIFLGYLQDHYERIWNLFWLLLKNFSWNRMEKLKIESPCLATNWKTQFHNFFNSEENQTLAIPWKFSGDFAELDERLKSIVEKSKKKSSQVAHICIVCGEEGHPRNIKDHIAGNHLDGIIIPCNLCNKTFRSWNGLRHHSRNKCSIIQDYFFIWRLWWVCLYISTFGIAQ